MEVNLVSIQTLQDAVASHLVLVSNATEIGEVLVLVMESLAEKGLIASIERYLGGGRSRVYG